ncbi:MAG: hypothetical protein KCHDKBKB_00811 [Elusimicrobia bacterium]|nr:hypothetical protein [Elusimicrobiota bacterium]
MIRRTALLLFSVLVGFTRISFATLTAYGLDKSNYTSDFMMGNVVVTVIFPESNGSLDPNTENWSEERKTQALSQIISGLDWWTQQNSRSPLSFTVVSQTVSVPYEPITRPYYDEALWIPSIMSTLGYSGSRFTTTRQFANAQRNAYGADWAFTIFVVDSLNDTNGKFADGFFAYAYLGGPFMVMTYDNNGYGINNMAVVAAHEAGHIFHALDQYAGASGPSDYSTGYFSTINGNHAYSSIANEPNSIMRGGIRWGLDKWAKESIGWRDANGNGYDDIMDQSPRTELTPSGSQLGGAGFSGQASVVILPRQGNAQGYGLTLDTISKVEYRMNNGSWVTTNASDGLFDSATENFNIVISASNQSIQNVTAKDVELRVTTSFSLRSGTPSTRSGGSQTNLDLAHAYPNPFKPNSNLGHSSVTFTDLSPGSKVQIFTIAGEPVFSKETASGAFSLVWDAKNEDGEPVASGIYYYLISDTAGHKKDGKIAVIR